LHKNGEISRGISPFFVARPMSLQAIIGIDNIFKNKNYTEDAKTFQEERLQKLEHLTNKQIIEYFHRSYKAADGLWFMKVEEKHGFNAALEIDKEIWKVMPKIQARMITSMLGMSAGEVSLLESLKVKLSLEGFKFKVEKKRIVFK
jgi:hypothetical protein